MCLRPLAITASLWFALVPVVAPAQDEPMRQWSSPPFQFHFPEPFRSDARNLEAGGSRLLPRMAAELGVAPPPRIDIWITPSGNRGRGAAPDWAAGYVPGGSTTIVIVRSRLGSYPSLEIEAVFLHELTHVLVNTMLGERADLLPRWFEEGVAMVQSRRWGVRDLYQVSTAFLRGRELPFASITRRFPRSEAAAQAAYAQSFSFLNYLARRHGEDLPRRILVAVRDGAGFEAAFLAATGRPVAAEEESWRESMIWKYRWIPILTSNGLLFSGLGLLFLLSYWRKRARVRQTLERWDRYEPPDDLFP